MILFLIPRTPYGEENVNKLNKLKELITICLRKWRNPRLSTKILKTYGVEDHLFKQIKKYNGIGCFIEDFIKQVHQYGILDEKRTKKW